MSIPPISIPVSFEHVDCRDRMRIALELLVSNVLSQPADCARDYDSRLRYLKERATVKMCAARGQGHTTSAGAVAKKYFQHPIVLSLSDRMAKTFMDFGLEAGRCRSITSLDCIRGLSRLHRRGRSFARPVYEDEKNL